MSPRTALLIARREFSVRVRSRSYLFGTVLLVLATAAIAFVPVIVGALDRGSTTTIAVHAPDDVSDETVATLSLVLNGSQPTAPGAKPDFVVTRVPDADAARTDVINGRYSALLDLERNASGDLTFTLYTNDSGSSRPAQLGRAAAASVAVSDRLNRLGISAQDQAALFAPPDFQVKWPDPAKEGSPADTVVFGTRYLLGFGMTILIFMMIILYGQWIAMSVVEEKTSRVMEVVLNAATPYELLTGKVLGVGSVALLQYLALLVTGIAALLLQGPIQDAVLGQGGGGVTLPEGLSPGVLLLFGVYAILGFLLYGVLYAAAGSMVSRQEDVQAAMMPLILISTVGYMIAVYGSTGLLDASSPVVLVLSQVPFLSPFMMLSRATSDQVTLIEIAASVAFLIAMIGVALWIASRIYSAGLLMYGQRPGIRSMLRMLRSPG